jgi:hypothetical protein
MKSTFQSLSSYVPPKIGESLDSPLRVSFDPLKRRVAAPTKKPATAFVARLTDGMAIVVMIHEQILAATVGNRCPANRTTPTLLFEFGLIPFTTCSVSTKELIFALSLLRFKICPVIGFATRKFLFAVLMVIGFVEFRLTRIATLLFL